MYNTAQGSAAPHRHALGCYTGMNTAQISVGESASQSQARRIQAVGKPWENLHQVSYVCMLHATMHALIESCACNCNSSQPWGANFDFTKAQISPFVVTDTTQ